MVLSNKELNQYQKNGESFLITSYLQPIAGNIKDLFEVFAAMFHLMLVFITLTEV